MHSCRGATKYKRVASFPEDFFAPLGEFGQPRRHYHQMRRLHNMVKGWGPLLADTTQTLPVVTPSAWNDNQTVRWSIRTDNHSAGFLFVK